MTALARSIRNRKRIRWATTSVWMCVLLVTIVGALDVREESASAATASAKVPQHQLQEQQQQQQEELEVARLPQTQTKTQAKTQTQRRKLHEKDENEASSSSEEDIRSFEIVDPLYQTLDADEDDDNDVEDLDDDDDFGPIREEDGVIIVDCSQYDPNDLPYYCQEAIQSEGGADGDDDDNDDDDNTNDGYAPDARPPEDDEDAIYIIPVVSPTPQPTSSPLPVPPSLTSQPPNDDSTDLETNPGQELPEDDDTTQVDDPTVANPSPTTTVPTAEPVLEPSQPTQAPIADEPTQAPSPVVTSSHNPTNEDIPGTGTDTGNNQRPPRNHIRIPLSVGIYNFDRLTDHRARDLVSLIVQVTTLLLDEYTPFHVSIPLQSRRLLNQQPQEQQAEEEGTGELLERTINDTDNESTTISGSALNAPREQYFIYQTNNGENDTLNMTMTLSGDPQSGGSESDPNQVQLELEDAESGNQQSNNDDDEDEEESEEDESVADFFLSGMLVEELPGFSGTRTSWLQLHVDYSVFWPNGKAINSKTRMVEFQEVSTRVINVTIDALLFEQRLQTEDRIIRQQNSSEEGVLSGIIPEYRPIQLVADGRDTTQPWIEKEIAVIATVAKRGKEYVLDDSWYLSDGADDDTLDAPIDAEMGIVYTEPLDLTWTVREWFGLGLFLATATLALMLSLLASYFMRHQQAQQLWGRSLTEEGVGELLQVGWTYHQQDGDDGNDDGQLFLQVFDKGRVGYNDENSVLHGSAVMAGGDTTGTPATTTSATGSMNTPPSPAPTY